MIQNFITNKTSITLFATNGYQMHGVITEETDDYIVIDFETIVFKRAISTIRPA